MDSPVTIYNPTGSKDRPARQSELRRSVKELEKLARGGPAAQRVHALNAIGMAQCLLGKEEAADRSFVSAASGADGVSLSSHDQYALRLNSQVHGCNGSVAGEPVQLAAIASRRATVCLPTPGGPSNR